MKKSISFTKSEMTALIVCQALTVIYCIAYTVLMLSDRLSGMAVIMIVITALSDGIFTVCTFYPQHTNLTGKENEKCSEEKLHEIRRGCITACYIIPAVMFVLMIAGSL